MQTHTLLSTAIAAFLDQLSADVCARQRSPSTLRYYTDTFRALVEGLKSGHGAELMVADLTPSAMRGSSWHVLQAAKRLCAWSSERGLCAHNALATVRLPRQGRRVRILSRGEAARLLHAAGSGLRRLLFVCLRTGARPGELRCACWSDVDWAARVIVLVEHKTSRRRTDGAQRIIALDPVVYRFLQSMFARRSPAEQLFVSRRGEPWSASALRQGVRKARINAGLSDDVCAYTLRHTMATWATRAGIRDRLLADLLGHTRTTTTQRYQHLDATDQLSALSRVHARLGR